jgi:hypothetical protein
MDRHIFPFWIRMFKLKWLPFLSNMTSFLHFFKWQLTSLQSLTHLQEVWKCTSWWSRKFTMSFTWAFSNLLALYWSIHWLIESTPSLCGGAIKWTNAWMTYDLELRVRIGARWNTATVFPAARSSCSWHSLGNNKRLSHGSHKTLDLLDSEELERDY